MTNNLIRIIAIAALLASLIFMLPGNAQTGADELQTALAIGYGQYEAGSAGGASEGIRGVSESFGSVDSEFVGDYGDEGWSEDAFGAVSDIIAQLNKPTLPIVISPSDLAAAKTVIGGVSNVLSYFNDKKTIATFNGLSTIAEYGGGRFAPIETVFSGLYDFSSVVADAHQEQLVSRADSLSYARQLAAAKYLSQSAYQVELAWRQEFYDIHGMSAGDMSDKDISQFYNNDYFTERLRELGFYRNDKYGNDVNRRNAIIRAQSQFNIPITAKIDLNTKRALIKGTDYVPRDLITGEHPDGMWAVIDKSARILTVYIDDTVFLKYPVAVGSSITLTPQGQFTFVIKAVNPRWGGGGYAEPIAGGAPNNPLGKRWMGLSVGGGGSYGVHGNVSPYSIGTYASHGCVRMINSDVEELYEFIQVGTPIWIGTTDKLAEWGIYQQLGCWAPDPPNYIDYLPQSDLYEE